MTQTQEMKTCCHGSKSCKSLNFRPLGDRILAKPLEAEEKKGNIILPDSARKKQEQARVIAIGTGKKDKNGALLPIPVQVGDIVLLNKYAGQQVTIDDEEYIIAGIDDLIAIVEK